MFDLVLDIVFMLACVYLAFRIDRQPTPEELAAAAAWPSCPGRSHGRIMTNGTMLQGFSWYLPADGSHWRRIAEQAPDFAYQGITAVWLPPAYKAEKGGEGRGLRRL